MIWKKGLSERGSIAPLGIGLISLSLSLVLTIAAAGSLFIFQKRLTNFAESAALYAARSGDRVVVFASRVGDHTFSEFSISSEDLPDGITLRVTACALWEPPVPVLGTITQRLICSHASARAE